MKRRLFCRLINVDSKIPNRELPIMVDGDMAVMVGISPAENHLAVFLGDLSL